jgi:hypothetical protein
MHLFVGLFMENDQQINMIEIFAGTPWQAGMVKSLLENAEIEAFLADEIIGTLSPWWADAGGAGPVKVFISNLDYDIAREIVQDYENNLKDEK